MNIAEMLSDKNKKIFTKNTVNIDEMYNWRKRYICKYYYQHRCFCTNKRTGKNCPFNLQKTLGHSCTTMFAKYAGYIPLSNRISREEYHSSKRIFIKK